MQTSPSKIVNPSVSIIVAVYNSGNYIKHCLNSLINQTFKDIEFILIDDGSTDDSGQICDNFAKMMNEYVLYTKKRRNSCDKAIRLRHI